MQEIGDTKGTAIEEVSRNLIGAMNVILLY
jgi:hypothetical protein